MSRFRARVVITVAGVVLGLAASGCKSQQSQQQQPEAVQRLAELDVLTADDMRAKLNPFSSLFVSDVIGSANKIANRTNDSRVRELSLQWKMRAVPGMRSIVLQEDPRVALVNAWVLTVRQRQLMTTGEFKNAFGDQQQIAVDTVVKLDKEMTDIARQFVSKEDFSKTQNEIEEFSGALALQPESFGNLIQTSAQAGTGKEGIGNFLAIPVSGVSESANAIDRVAYVAAAFTEVIQQLPEYARWQTELLLLEIEAQDTVVETRDNFDRLTTSIESIAKTAESLPVDVREQLQVAIDTEQEKIRATLTEARQTIQELDKTIIDAREITTTVNEATVNLTKAGDAWGATADSVNQLLASYKEIAGPSEPKEPAPKPTAEGEDQPDQIQQMTQLAEEIRSATVELRSLLGDLSSGKLNTALSGVSETSTSLINVITIRTVMVIGAMLVALVLYRMIAVKLVKAR